MCTVLHQFAKLNDNNPSYSGAELSQVLRYIAYLNLMDAGLFIYFPRDLGQKIYLKVFDGQDIYFKKHAPPPPPPPPPVNVLHRNQQ